MITFQIIAKFILIKRQQIVLRKHFLCKWQTKGCKSFPKVTALFIVGKLFQVLSPLILQEQGKIQNLSILQDQSHDKEGSRQQYEVPI